MVEVKGSHCVDVAINRINDDLTINLVNTSGPHANNNIYVYDEIEPIGPLQIKVRMDKKPEKVMLQPEGRDLTYSFIEGNVEFELSKLDIYEIITIR